MFNKISNGSYKNNQLFIIFIKKKIRKLWKPYETFLKIREEMKITVNIEDKLRNMGNTFME